jgi:Tol biopolymer transport system component
MDNFCSMKLRRNHLFFLAICLFVPGFLACNSKPSSPKASASPTPAPTPKPKPIVAYLKEGDLWMIRSDGSDERVLAVAPEGDTIQDFVWSADGSRVYYVVGLQLFEVVIASSTIASAGELTAPPGVTIDRIQMGRDGKTIAVTALDADAASRMYALTIGQREAKELAIDEFNSLIPQIAPVIRAIGEMSVSPDARWILFKDIVGTGEELFIANGETGARMQLTNLYGLGGFEESVETEGGRRVIEAAWSSDGRFVIFNPMQYCSEIGFCSGRLFLVDVSGGVQLQLSVETMVSTPSEWTGDGNLLVYDDGSKVVVADTQGYPKALAEGHHPKWQPTP